MYFKEWDGEGLPHVGCKCQMELCGALSLVTITAYGERKVLVKDGLEDEFAVFKNKAVFRPIRSEEEQEVDKLVKVLMDHHEEDGVNTDDLALHLQVIDHAKAIYKAGYHK